MAIDYKAEALRMISAIGGGALAGAVDIEFASTMPLGLPVGAWGGLGLTLAGLAGQSNAGFRKVASALGEVGIGMLAAEAGFATASRLVKMKQAAAAPGTTVLDREGNPQQGVQGVPRSRGAFNSRQPISAQSLRQQIAAMAAR